MNTMTLPVILTETELILKGHELAEDLQELADIELRKKTAMNGFKEEIESIEVKVSDLARIVREGKEYREVEVKEERDEERMVMNTIRLDTGEIVKYRELQGHERNLKLFPASIKAPGN